MGMSMNEPWYTYSGDIDKKTTAETLVWLNGQLHSQGQNITRLRFFISSGGGDIDSAISLYDYLKAFPSTVETIGFGRVESAAVLIFLAGSKRSVVKDCRFLLHEGLYTLGQPTNTLHVHEETLNLFRTLLDRVTEIVASETSHQMNEVAKILREGRTFTAVEAKEFGLVQEIIDEIPQREQQV